MKCKSWEVMRINEIRTMREYTIQARQEKNKVDSFTLLLVTQLETFDKNVFILCVFFLRIKSGRYQSVFKIWLRIRGVCRGWDSESLTYQFDNGVIYQRSGLRDFPDPYSKWPEGRSRPFDNARRYLKTTAKRGGICHAVCELTTQWKKFLAVGWYLHFSWIKECDII